MERCVVDDDLPLSLTAVINKPHIREGDYCLKTKPNPKNVILGREAFIFRVVEAMLAHCRVADTSGTLETSATSGARRSRSACTTWRPTWWTR